MKKVVSMILCAVLMLGVFAGCGAQKPEDVMKDEEGLQTMRNIGRNMAWMVKCFAAGKQAGIVLPKTELEYSTNFIREV